MGQYSLGAVFTPDQAAGVGSRSAAVPYVVYNAATTTSLTALPNIAIANVTPVTMTAMVAPATAPGAIQFYDVIYDRNTWFRLEPLGGPVPLVAGVAIKVSTLKPNSWGVGAQYVASNPTSFGPSSATVPIMVS